MPEEVKETRLPLREIKRLIGDAFSGTFWRYALITLLLVIATTGNVAEPVIYGTIINQAIALTATVQSALHSLSDEGFRSLLGLLLLWAGIDVVATMARELASYRGFKVADTVWRKFWQKKLHLIINLDPEVFQSTSTGSLSKQLDSLGSATWKLSANVLNTILPPVLSLIAFLIVGFHIHIAMTVIALLGVIPLFIIASFTQLFVEKRQDKMNESWENFTGKLGEIIQNIVPIKSFGAEKRIADWHLEIGRETMTRQTAVDALFAIFGTLSSIARFFARFAVFFAGLYFISQGSLNVGQLVTFLTLVATLIAPFEQVFGELMRRLADIRASFTRVHHLLTRKNALIDPAHPKILKHIKGHLVFKNVSYRYPSSKDDSLKKVALDIPAGTSLALVGPSGSGKSTLVKFAHRFLDPTSGTVTIDGVDIKQLALQAVRQAVGVVHQETVLFNDTVMNNLLFANPKASKADVIAACKKAQAHDFIEHMPNKYETIIGERGVKLSGGERQRLALARIFLANPPILILDESTSALDSETELKLQAALKEAMHGRTTVIIAHRLSTIYLADNIAVLDHGELKELGTHAELLQEKGLYNRLWTIQSGGYI